METLGLHELGKCKEGFETSFCSELEGGCSEAQQHQGTHIYFPTHNGVSDQAEICYNATDHLV